MTIDMRARVEAPTLRALIAEEIRSLMARRQVTGVALAARIGRSQSYVSRRLVGEAPFDVDDLETIARALGVQIVDLLPRALTGLPRTLGYPQSHVGESMTRPPDNRPSSRPRSPAGRPGPGSTRTRRVGS